MWSHTNKNSILALLDNVKENGEQFKKRESDIKLINLFLDWENEEKNKLANRLFKGKRFILDANIIFRLAVINNDVRMNAIKSFVEKCKEVGVTLCYTTATLDEIKRVIVSKVQWIKSVTGSQEPFRLSTFSEMYRTPFSSGMATARL